MRLKALSHVLENSTKFLCSGIPTIIRTMQRVRLFANLFLQQKNLQSFILKRDQTVYNDKNQYQCNFLVIEFNKPQLQIIEIINWDKLNKNETEVIIISVKII